MVRRRGHLETVIFAAAILAFPAGAGERQLEDGPAPKSAREIKTSIQLMTPKPPAKRQPLIPWLSKPLENLPPFFADSRLEARYRTYYLRDDGTDGDLREAWAMGGSISYRSGWLADLFSAELEGFTSQPIVALEDRDGTELLEPGQNGYSVLGIANGKLRYEGFILTGGRQYLDLPFVNRNDHRMTPNTFEAIALEKPEGEINLVAGYAWNIKERNSDEFVSFAKAAGADANRGLAYGGLLWDPNEDFHFGVFSGAVPDLFGRAYTELGLVRNLTEDWEARIDGQFTYKFQVGDKLLENEQDDTWSLGIRTALSRNDVVLRLGFSIAGPDGQDQDHFGVSPLYLDLMQRTFNRPNEKAVGVSASYDFEGIGIQGLSGIVSFAAGFDGEVDGVIATHKSST